MVWQAMYIQRKGNLQMGEKPLKPLDDERVDGVAGGYIFCSDDINVYPAKKPWEIIDDKGGVVARFEDFDDARYFAKKKGYGTRRLHWYELEKLRETGSPW